MHSIDTMCDGKLTITNLQYAHKLLWESLTELPPEHLEYTLGVIEELGRLIWILQHSQ